MKIVVACDSFKGSLSAKQIGDIIKESLLKYSSDFEAINVPMGDGGEGTVDALIAATNGKVIKVDVWDPLKRVISAEYGITGCGKTAVIEMAASSGLPLLSKQEQNPLIATTYGFGQLILDALDKGCRDFIIGIGGSATNDGGVGMLSALGCKFYDDKGSILSTDITDFERLDHIDVSGMDSRINKSTFKVACDVSNELCGEQGATYIYGTQKGVTEQMRDRLDNILSRYSEVIKKNIGIDVSHIKGGGAAGGLGAALVAFLNGKLNKGIDIVIEAVNLEDTIKDADLVITGEGRIDSQTRFGKTPYGVAKISKKYGVDTIAICGGVESDAEILYDHGFDSIFSIIDKPMSLEQAVKDTEQLLKRATTRIIRLYMLGKN